MPIAQIFKEFRPVLGLEFAELTAPKETERISLSQLEETLRQPTPLGEKIKTIVFEGKKLISFEITPLIFIWENPALRPNEWKDETGRTRKERSLGYLFTTLPNQNKLAVYRYDYEDSAVEGPVLDFEKEYPCQLKKEENFTPKNLQVIKQNQVKSFWQFVASYLESKLENEAGVQEHLAGMIEIAHRDNLKPPENLLTALELGENIVGEPEIGTIIYNDYSFSRISAVAYLSPYATSSSFCLAVIPEFSFMGNPQGKKAILGIHRHPLTPRLKDREDFFSLPCVADLPIFAETPQLTQIIFHLTKKGSNLTLLEPKRAPREEFMRVAKEIMKKVVELSRQGKNLEEATEIIRSFWEKLYEIKNISLPR